MQAKDIDNFFDEVSKLVSKPISVALTGGAAANLMGNVRNTEDIDFEYRSDMLLSEVQRVMDAASAVTGIATQFSDDIDHWSMISYADYRKKLKLYRRFKDVQVDILSAEHWSIGKLARYTDVDVDDLVAVFKLQKPALEPLLSLWLKALKLSPKSSAQFEFRRHIGHFLHEHGRVLWGKAADIEAAIKKFS